MPMARAKISVPGSSMSTLDRSSLKPGGRYYIIVLIYWSRFLDRGDSSRAFLIEIASP